MLLDNQSGSNQTELLERVKNARGSAEPSEPTEEPQAQEVTPDEVEAEVEQVEELEQPLEVEAEPVELEVSAEKQESDQEEFYVEIDGSEISFNEIREMKKGNLRQDDYTRKSQANAEDKKLIVAEKESLATKNQQLEESIASLQVFVDEFNDTEIDGMSLTELREYDPSKYLEVTEKQTARKEALKKAKSAKSTASDTDRQGKAQEELSKLVNNNPQWIKDGKETPAYQSDMKVVNDYLNTLGYTEDMRKGILTNGNGQIFIDAAKYHVSKKSNAALSKKVRKAPVVTKPGGASKSVATTNLEKAKAAHREYGTIATAMALRKAQTQFKGD
jgi:hypothetical protein